VKLWEGKGDRMWYVLLSWVWYVLSSEKYEGCFVMATNLEINFAQQNKTCLSRQASRLEFTCWNTRLV
jgi:hypothetical protein